MGKPAKRRRELRPRGMSRLWLNPPLNSGGRKESYMQQAPRRGNKPLKRGIALEMVCRAKGHL